MTAPTPPTGHLYAFTDDGPVWLRLLESDLQAFHALPGLDREAETPRNFTPPAVLVVDLDSGLLYEVSRWWCGPSYCGCAAFADVVPTADDVAEEEQADEDADVISGGLPRPLVASAEDVDTVV